MGAAWNKRDQVRDFYIIRIVPFCWPQLVGVSKGFGNVDTGWGLGDDTINVGREDEMGVKSLPVCGVCFPEVAETKFWLFDMAVINIFHIIFIYN